MAAAKTEFVYEPFADTEEYNTVNSDLIGTWIESLKERGHERVDRLLDIATGVGTMAKLFLDNLPTHWSTPTVVCLDQSKEALEQTKRNLQGKTTNVEFMHSRVQDMDLPENSIDVALWGNGIHYLDADEQEEALVKVKRALKSGGWLFFNSAFYAESRPPETIAFYRAQVRRAVEYLKSKGINRDRMDVRPSASNFFAKEYYEDLVKKAGFSLEDAREKVVRLSGVAMEHISTFQQYAAGALHGYNPPDAAEAMKVSVAPAMEQHGEPDANGILAVRRNWLSISASVS